MVDPRVGVVSACEFLSLAGVKKWLDENQPRPVFKKFLPEPEPEIVSPEERERRVKMLKDAAQVIRDTVKAKTVGRPRFEKTQRHDPEALLKTDLMKVSS